LPGILIVGEFRNEESYAHRCMEDLFDNTVVERLRESGGLGKEQKDKIAVTAEGVSAKERAETISGEKNEESEKENEEQKNNYAWWRKWVEKLLEKCWGEEPVAHLKETIVKDLGFIPLLHALEEEEEEKINRGRLYRDLSHSNLDVQCVVSVANSIPTANLLRLMGPLTTRPIAVMVASHFDLREQKLWEEKSWDETVEVSENRKTFRSAGVQGPVPLTGLDAVRDVKSVQEEETFRIAPTNAQQAATICGHLRRVHGKMKDWDIRVFTSENEKGRKSEIHADDIEDEVVSRLDAVAYSNGLYPLAYDGKGVECQGEHMAVLALGHTTTLVDLPEKLEQLFAPPLSEPTWRRYSSSKEKWRWVDERRPESLTVLYSDGCSEWDRRAKISEVQKAVEAREALDKMREYLGRWAMFGVSVGAYRIVSSTRPSRLLRNVWDLDDSSVDAERLRESFRDEEEKSSFVLEPVAPLNEIPQQTRSPGRTV